MWTKENPTPWNDIKPNEGTKLLTVNQHFEKGYVRCLCALSPVRGLMDVIYCSWERKKL